MDWYYTNGRSKHGPIDEEGIRIRAQKGYVKPDTFLWNETMRDWKTAAELGFFPDEDAEPTMCIAPPPPSAAPSLQPPRSLPSVPSLPEPAPVAVHAAAVPDMVADHPEKSACPPSQPAPAPQPSINVSVNTGAGLEQPISVGNWMLTFIVMCIPVVNIIMLFVWAFGGSSHKSKSNWARAALLLMLIIFLGWLLFFVVLGSLFASAFH